VQRSDKKLVRPVVFQRGITGVSESALEDVEVLCSLGVALVVIGNRLVLGTQTPWGPFWGSQKYRVKSDPRSSPHIRACSPIPAAAFHPGRLKEKLVATHSPTLSSIEYRRKQMARPSSFHIVQLSR
jgi:hypothetical protein